MTATSPISGQALTLANSIIGVGILAMPFCFKQCGIVLSVLILICSGVVSRLACHFLLKSAIYSRRDNIESLAYYVFGAAGKFAAEIGIIGFLMGTCVAYFVVVGDLGPQIIAKMFNLNQSDFLRTCVMVMVSLVCVLPLGLLRNVDSFSYVSAGTIGFYFCLVLKILFEAANPLFSGDWMSKVVYWRMEGVLQCSPIFSMALCCQTQLFEIFDTLPNATLEKMNAVTKNAVNICTIVYIFVGCFGYIAFCHQPISGNILINFSPTMGSDMIQVGFVMSLAFSFPLIIFPCRASLYSLLYRKGQAHNQELINNLIPKLRFKLLTIIIIVVTLVIGVLLPNIELVLGLVGSTIGIMICVIFPSTCFICITVKRTNERILAQIVLCLGIVLMVLGTYANLQAVETDNIGLETKIAIEKDKFSSNDNEIIKNIGTKDDPGLNIGVIDKVLIKETKDSIEPPNMVEISAKVSDSKVQPPNPVPPVEENKTKAKLFPPSLEMNKVESKDEKIEGAGDKEVVLKLDNSPSFVTDESIMKDTKMEKEEELMKTIKKHAEVQRQMVEEQKEILEEIKEMKKSIESKQKEEVHKNRVTHQKAVENIKMLAKAALESLQDMNTEAPVVKQIIEDMEKQQVAESIIENNHIHKQDEPESYKVGEETNQLKVKDNVNTVPKKSAIPEDVPIALVLSKASKMNDKKVENEVFKEGVKVETIMGSKKENVFEGVNIEKTKHNKQTNDKNEIVKDSLADKAQPLDYSAGKRDILSVETEKITVHKAGEAHRNKRDIEETNEKKSCTNHVVENNGANSLQGEKDIVNVLYKQFESKNLDYHTRSLKSTNAKR